MLVAEEVHFLDHRILGSRIQTEAQHDDRQQVQGEHPNDPFRQGQVVAISLRFEVPDDCHRKQYVQRGPEQDRQRKAGHVAQPVHLVQTLGCIRVGARPGIPG